VAAIYYALAVPVFWFCARLSRLNCGTFWGCFFGTSLIAVVILFAWDFVVRVVFAVGRIPMVSVLAVWTGVVGVPSFILAKVWPWRSVDGRPLRFAISHFVTFSLVYGVVDLVIIGHYYTPTESMQPTIRVGDYLLIDRRPSGHALATRARSLVGGRPILRGDMIVFERDFSDDGIPGGTRRIHMLKRCVGLPGETVSVNDGRVRIGDKDLAEDYKSKYRSELRSGRLRDALDPVLLGQDEYYVLGDNRDASQDSRFFGPVRRESLRGRAVAIYWPPWRASWLQ
jgi:signal peptidase I